MYWKNLQMKDDVYGSNVRRFRLQVFNVFRKGIKDLKASPCKHCLAAYVQRDTRNYKKLL